MQTDSNQKPFDGGQEMSMWMTLMHEAMAAKLGINATDLKCISLVKSYPGLKPSEIAEQMGITRGSVTTMLDRLERRKFIQRYRDKTDGRQMRVEMRNDRQSEIGQVYASLGRRMGALYSKYKPEELKFIQVFMEELTAVCRAEIEELNQQGR